MDPGGRIGVIFGPPGSGKGTQAGLLEARAGIAHLSTGEILRAEVELRSPLGKEVAGMMAAGQLVPDGVMERLIEQRLAGVGRENVLLDGFPRTVEQARALDALLDRNGRGVDLVLALRAPDDLLVERLLHRAAVEGRTDDTPEAIQERLLEYHALTAPVLDRYRRQGTRVDEIDAVGPVEEIYARTRRALTGGA